MVPGQGKCFNPVFHKKGAGTWPDNVITTGDKIYDSSHSCDVITDFSIEWLKKRDPKKPFFLMHPFKAPHDSVENAERYDFLYEDVTISEPASLRDVPTHGSEAKKDTGTSIGKRNTRRNMGDQMFADESPSTPRTPPASPERRRSCAKSRSTVPVRSW